MARKPPPDKPLGEWDISVLSGAKAAYLAGSWRATRRRRSVDAFPSNVVV